MSYFYVFIQIHFLSFSRIDYILTNKEFLSDAKKKPLQIEAVSKIYLFNFI
jgi:hypothetical protein